MDSLLSSLPLVLALSIASAVAEDTTLSVNVDQPAGNVSPTLYGLMTEEINHSYDGGLYGELVQNRAFLDNPETPAHWSVVQGLGATASITLDQADPLNQYLTNSLRLDVTAASEAGPGGVANDGYWGIPVRPNEKYHLSLYARSATNFKGPIKVSIQSDDGSIIYAEGKISHVGTEWKRHTVTLKMDDVPPTAKARLVLTIDRPGTVWFNLVSLFPPTYDGTENGNRIDIMQKLAEMKPSFLRFPGGNYVEGDTLETRFNWKKTIGPNAQRPGHACCWGYRSSDGMGLLEFLEWCEDLKMQPVLAVYAGYNLNHTHIAAGPALQPYVQDALDEIEYVTGDRSTQWGAERAKDGHSAPFHLTYVEIGNEDWFDRSGSYDARFAQFYDAIKAKYPNLQCISTIGTEHREQMVQSRKPDVIDEHYYSSAAEFESDWAHWDNYDHNGPKIFVGEWAAYEDVKPWERTTRKFPPTPTLKSGLADAAWMAAMERHSDLIVMQCYAPLFVNVNPGARQWRPDLIGYDALRVYGSPSYYAIQMFSQNHGATILGTSVENGPLRYDATRDSKSGAIYLKFVNPESAAKPVHVSLHGVGSIAPTGTALTMSGATLDDSNSIDDPEHVVPVTTTVSGMSPDFTYTLAPYSVTVLTLNSH